MCQRLQHSGSKQQFHDHFPISIGKETFFHFFVFLKNPSGMKTEKFPEGHERPLHLDFIRFVVCRNSINNPSLLIIVFHNIHQKTPLLFLDGTPTFRADPKKIKPAVPYLKSGLLSQLPFYCTQGKEYRVINGPATKTNEMGMAIRFEAILTVGQFTELKFQHFF